MAGRLIAAAIAIAIVQATSPATAQCCGTVRVLNVSIDADGALYVDAEPSDERGVRRAARAHAEQLGLSHARVVVAAHTRARQKHVNRVMALLARTGIRHIALHPFFAGEN